MYGMRMQIHILVQFWIIKLFYKIIHPTGYTTVQVQVVSN